LGTDFADNKAVIKDGAAWDVEDSSSIADFPFNQ
jgi:hypothetical protein